MKPRHLLAAVAATCGLLTIPLVAVASTGPKPRASTGVLTLAGGQSEIIYCVTNGEHWNRAGTFPLHDYCPLGPPPVTTTTSPVTTTVPPVTTTVPTGVFRLFGASSLWNTIKAPTDYAAAATSVIQGIDFELNNGAYDHPFYIAKSSDPLTTFHLGAGWGHQAETITANAPAGMSQASGGDADMDVLLTDGTLLDMYGLSGGGTNWTAAYYGTSDGINGPGFGTQPYAAIGTTAIGSPQAAGTILASDVASGVIPHGLTMACDYGYLGGATTGAGDQVAPAVSNDDGGGGGPLPEGGLLFIPPGTQRPSGLNAMGVQMWDAASTEGVYITDQAGGGCYFYGDGSGAVGNAITSTDTNDVGHALKLVVNWLNVPKEKVQPSPCPAHPKSGVGCPA